MLSSNDENSTKTKQQQAGDVSSDRLIMRDTGMITLKCTGEMYLRIRDGKKQKCRLHVHSAENKRKIARLDGASTHSQ